MDITIATTKSVMFVVAPAILGAINLAVVKFGHSFAPFANMGLLSGGLIGVVQGVASHAFLYLLAGKLKLEYEHVIPLLLVAHVLSAAALFAISALAVKAGIMASPLALSGLAILTLANIALSYGVLFLELTIFFALWIEDLRSRTGNRPFYSMTSLAFTS